MVAYPWVNGAAGEQRTAVVATCIWAAGGTFCGHDAMAAASASAAAVSSLFSYYTFFGVFSLSLFLGFSRRMMAGQQTTKANCFWAQKSSELVSFVASFQFFVFSFFFSSFWVVHLLAVGVRRLQGQAQKTSQRP